MQLPPVLQRLRIATSSQSTLPTPLMARIDALRPWLRQRFLSPLPPGWQNAGSEEPFELEYGP